MTGRGTARSMTVSASAGGIGQRVGERARLVQRRPRRILAGDSRPLDHLLRLQQILDQLVGGVRLIAVRVDGQLPTRRAPRSARRPAPAGIGATANRPATLDCDRSCSSA